MPRILAERIWSGPSTPVADWSRPWLQAYRADGEWVEAAWRSGQPVYQALNALPLAGMAANAAVRFVPQTELPAGEAYEAFINRTGSVPTRDHWHDLFNGLVWRRFPLIKRRLNQLQAQAIAAQCRVTERGAVRGALRDALTLFDENAALLQAPEPLLAALRQRDWQALFIHLRPLWAQAQLTLFGHALMEKLLRPRKAITAHVWLLPIGAEVQALALDSLTPEALTAKPFLPLPVLGVPMWWTPNHCSSFYDDLSVFRPAATLAAARPAKNPRLEQGQTLKNSGAA